MTFQAVIQRLEERPEYLRSNWTLPPDAARFLYILARSCQIRQVLEIGTSIGYSTLHLAWAASETGGHVTTIDADPGRQGQAAQNLQEAGLSERVTLLTGDALSVLDGLQQQGARFDFMFLDARKSEYIQYLAYAEQLMPEGALLLADNTRSHRDEMVDFIQAISGSRHWVSCDMDTANGFILARKRDVSA